MLAVLTRRMCVIVAFGMPWFLSLGRISTWIVLSQNGKIVYNLCCSCDFVIVLCFMDRFTTITIGMQVPLVHADVISMASRPVHIGS